MCGIAGRLHFQPRLTSQELRAELEPIVAALSHRGPDGSAIWTDPEAGISLGHRSLQIMEQGPGGQQPRPSPSGRYQLCFNGEVYNYRELRQELSQRSYSFPGGGDTEVLLAAFDEWGPERVLDRIDGMFALSLWDGQTRQLLLARDRLGEKPLFWGKFAKGWAFASELRALQKFADCPTRLDRTALSLYLQHGWVPDPWSMIEGISKVEPGTFLWLPTSNSQAKVRSFWRPEFQPLPASVSVTEQLAEVGERLQLSVKRRLQAARPVGLLLSGGLDSTLVSCLARQIFEGPLPSFTIGFEQSDYNEADSARAIARHLGLQHHEWILGDQEVQDRVRGFVRIFDEPFGDSCLIATHCVAEMARSQVSVVLTGDGGDELFSGYHRYFKIQVRWHQQGRRGHLEQLHLAATALGFLEPQTLLKDPVDPPLVYRPTPHRELARAFQDWDLRHYLPGDILRIVDQGTMACGLEARCPFLARDLVEYATRLPSQLGSQKMMLRRLLSRHLPAPLFQRPKQGFCVPIGAWLRGPLRSWAQDLLDPGYLGGQGLFLTDQVSEIWKRHLGGEELGLPLYVLLIFQEWYRARGQ